MDEAEIRRRLEARLEELQRLDAGAGDDDVTLDQQRVGRLSRMDALQAQAMAGATRARRQSELRRIRAALARLADGDYGLCTGCDAPIPDGRLEIDPAAALCVACAERETG